MIFFVIYFLLFLVCFGMFFIMVKIIPKCGWNSKWKRISSYLCRFFFGISRSENNFWQKIMNGEQKIFLQKRRERNWKVKKTTVKIVLLKPLLGKTLRLILLKTREKVDEISFCWLCHFCRRFWEKIEHSVFDNYSFVSVFSSSGKMKLF